MIIKRTVKNRTKFFYGMDIVSFSYRQSDENNNIEVEIHFMNKYELEVTFAFDVNEKQIKSSLSDFPEQLNEYLENCEKRNVIVSKTDIIALMTI